MEASSLNIKTHNHSRSNSLPSKPHPIILQCNEYLAILGVGVSFLICTIVSKNLLQLPLTQEALVHQPREKWVDELFEGSLMLLDVCTATKDALLHMKECSRELQSIVRRRRQGQVKLTLEVKKSLTSKKVVRKSIFKDLENLKGHHANKCNPSMINKEYQIFCHIRIPFELYF
ncbi:hypothetical protein Ahy_A03g016511 [Arachis hypogaea]|uniref:Uncharacterized protein n=1 Tax=Arachis hypogaea TaxID=3818 RepID=A0A445E3G8_ARAHY|nr:hypothetical protein Ahy_A03g016511 [Arachis hypogaea]